MAQAIGPKELAARALREANYQRGHVPADRKAMARHALAEGVERVSKPKATKGRKKTKRSGLAKSAAPAVE